MKRIYFPLLLLFLIGCQATPTASPPTAEPTSAPDTQPTSTLPPPTQTSTPTPEPALTHVTTVWHFPAGFPGFEHHHGVNPADYVEVFGSALSDYLATYGTVSYPWQTPDENSPVGLGHHHGYVWLYDQAKDGCELFNNGKKDVESLSCITDVMMQIHTDGTLVHLRKRFHSHYVFMRVCDQATRTQCGTVATGGWVDYGIMHAPYKKAQCPLPGVDPEAPEGHVFDLNQPPYRTSQIEWRQDLAVQFWSGLRPNAVVANLYPEQPNYTIGVAWSTLDAWGIVDPAHCADPAYDISGISQGVEGMNNSVFQLWTVSLYQHPPAPFTGWTNRWGHEVEDCTQASLDCVPFIVTEGVPDGGALLNRRVQQGNPDLAPYLEFDPGGGVLTAPEG